MKKKKTESLMSRFVTKNRNLILNLVTQRQFTSITHRDFLSGIVISCVQWECQLVTYPLLIVYTIVYTFRRISYMQACRHEWCSFFVRGSFGQAPIRSQGVQGRMAIRMLANICLVYQVIFYWMLPGIYPTRLLPILPKLPTLPILPILRMVPGYSRVCTEVQFTQFCI